MAKRKSNLSRKVKTSRVKNESEQDRNVRLTTMREVAIRRRKNETEYNRQNRLATKITDSLRRIKNETEKERITRLETTITDSQRRIKNETEEERIMRLETKITDSQRRIKHETEEERITRIENLNVNFRRYIMKETNEMRSERLVIQNINNKRTLERESTGNKKKRLKIAKDAQLQISSNIINVKDIIYNIWRSNVSGIDWNKAAFHYNKNTDYNNDQRISIGQMNVICKFCKAKRFKNESKGICCKQGKVQIETLEEPPYPLNDLLFNRSPDSKLFFNNIRNYNSAFQMTSFGASKIIRENFMPTFKIQGQVYHRIGSIYPEKINDEKYLQIYFMGNNEEEVNRRNEHFPFLRHSLLKELQDLLHNNNDKIKEIKYALERNNEPHFKLVIKENYRPKYEHARRFNKPTTNEVAILMIGDSTNKRDIIINKRDSTIQSINETHPSYDCLQYPLIFWKGQSGYGINLKQSNGKKMSCMNYYAYLIMVRENDYNVILHFRELYHQYATYMYAKVEGERLAFIRFNQEQLRTDNYDNVKDAMNNDREAHNLGQIVILPSSYTGSPRYMRERQQDAMAYVRRFGKPDLFITFTCNPEWKEIKENLFNNQKVIHRHDITARVCRQYVLKLVDSMKNANIFGKQICYMYTIEWQKRGLPHAHLLSWLQESIKPTQVDSIDSIRIL